MSNNVTDSELADEKREGGIAIAIVLPSLFAIVIIILVAMRRYSAFLLPRLSEENAEEKEARKQRRLARLDSSVKSQHYVEWAAKQSREHPGTAFTINPLCVICLEEFDDAASIRGLGCLHVFHQKCLDDWFGRWNEYCPLCHRPIIQGMSSPKKRRESSEENPPIAFLV
ncbi:hypothetical protein BS50DRAFT_634626 [Corynespora cassiicola Philippines]|uniref:RING-type domain-containing protein n=1 Tax=Corynespora cassiicola Philippines TaxID=1448308 RepID=A0A2T2NP87_CORCC|nr:hypothetical protein BS50DRAFT_634626 [Corynespora cassiicola Philippines]